MVKKVIISSGREVGGLNAFATSLAEGFREIGIEAEVLPIKEILLNKRGELGDKEVLKILSTSAMFFAPFFKNTIGVAHGFPVPSVQGYIRWVIILLFYKLSFKFGKFVCVSHYVRTHLRDLFGLDSHAAINNPVGKLFLSENGDGIEKRYITYIGRLIPIKKVENFIEPLKKVLDENPQYSVKIIGHGTQAKIITDKINNDDRFEILPALTPAEVRDVLSKTKLFFSGCETEALGIGYIEALTQGSNIVMPNAGGGLEIAHELLGKRVFTYRLDMGFDTVYETLCAALAGEDKAEFDVKPFIPKNVAEQYLAVANEDDKGKK